MTDREQGPPPGPGGPALPPPRGEPYRVCLVCTGNICRSPMAEVVLRQMAGTVPVLVGRLEVTSAGTGAWHVGEPMDARAREVLARRGYRDHGHLARHVERALAARLDLLVALDHGHRRALGRMSGCPPVVLLGAFGPGAGPPGGHLTSRPAAAGRAPDVPDPYYGDVTDFDRCLHQIEASCRGLAAALAAVLGDGAA